ncbi:hypothetical protein KZZ07_06975 [Mameliella sp. CS4]|nr:hypothetical protein [Mameliella sp. CS4]MBW4982281.1 hypothetical protein [Mameliella sp. CS4]
MHRASMGTQDFGPQVQQSIGRLPPFDVTSACAIDPHVPEGDRDSEAS